MNANKPGVMLYFSLRPFFAYLPNDLVGTLVCAVMDYAKDGTEPEFTDPHLMSAWFFMKEQVDVDDARYTGISEKRRTAANKRWEQERANAMQAMPNSDTNTNTNSNSYPYTNTKSFSVSRKKQEKDESRDISWMKDYANKGRGTPQ